MEGFDSQSSQPEGNNFDNDFEKLDPFGAPAYGGDDLVSSSGQQRDTPEEDLYSATPATSEAEPLVSLGDDFPAAAVTQPTVTPPDSSSKTTPATASEKSGKTDAKSACCSAGPLFNPVLKFMTSGRVGSQDVCAWLKSIDPRVLDLIYWRDVKKTGIVFGSMMVLLLSLALFSVLSVVAYLSLAALTITISFRVYKNILGAVQKSGDGHPFKPFLEYEIELPKDKLHELADVVMGHVSCTIKELRRLFFIEDFVDSLKFGLLLWVLTYIGAWFNGMTLIILGVVGAFTLPKFYETYKVQIDQYVDLITTKVQGVYSQVKDKLPLPKKKSE